MVIWIVNLNTRLKMKILITDIDDTLLDWTKSFDIFARKHFGYTGIALSKNPQRLWDALNTTKENIPEFMKAHNESSEFAQLEYLNDSEILNNVFDKFDKIFCMDTKNYQDVLSLAESETQKNKVSMILEEAGNHGNAEVPDPYYGTMQDFENVFQMLDQACEIIAEKYDLK